MKYLYYILRLFFCPHKWKFIKSINIIDENNNPLGNDMACQCQRCGKFKSWRV